MSKIRNPIQLMGLVFLFLFMLTLASHSFSEDADAELLSQCQKMANDVQQLCSDTEQQCDWLKGCAARRNNCKIDHTKKENCSKINACMADVENKIDQYTGRVRENFFHTHCTYEWDQKNSVCANSNKPFDYATFFCPGRMKLIIDRDFDFNCEGNKKTLRRYQKSCNEKITNYHKVCGKFLKNKNPPKLLECRGLDVDVFTLNK